jgi:hypothetical protein
MSESSPEPEPSIPTLLLFHQLRNTISVEKMIDMNWLWTAEPMPNGREEVMKNLQSTMPFMVPGTQPQTEELPREDVISHIESKNYMVFGKSDNPEVGAQALYLKDNLEVMNQIKNFIQENQDVDTMTIVWMEVEGEEEEYRAIYSIEMDCEELDDHRSGDSEGEDVDAVENITTMTQDIIQSLMMSNIDEEERDDFVRQLQELSSH